MPGPSATPLVPLMACSVGSDSAQPVEPHLGIGNQDAALASATSKTPSRKFVATDGSSVNTYHQSLPQV